MLRYTFKKDLCRSAFIFSLASGVLSSSAYASEFTVVKNTPSQPIVPNWILVSVNEDSGELLVDQNRIYQQTIAEQETFIDFVARFNDPNLQTMTDLFVTADCSTNHYAILQAELIDRNGEQQLDFYVYPPEEVEVKVAEENTMIRYAIDYACGS